MAKWSFEYVVRLWTDGGFQSVADQHNREVTNEKHDSTSTAGGSDHVADHPADGAAYTETASVRPVCADSELRGEGRALPVEQDIVKTPYWVFPMHLHEEKDATIGMIRVKVDLSGSEGNESTTRRSSTVDSGGENRESGMEQSQHSRASLPTQLNEIAERCESVLPLGDEPLAKKIRIEQLIRALHEATAYTKRLLSMREDDLAQLRQDVAEMNDYVKQAASKVQQAEAKLEDNWSCKQKVIAQQTERIRELGKQLEAKEFELQQAWIIAREFGFRSKND